MSQHKVTYVAVPKGKANVNIGKVPKGAEPINIERKTRKNEQKAQQLPNNIAKVNTERHFDGHHAKKISIKNCLGPQAESSLRLKYAHLDRQNKLIFSGTGIHDHSYAAWCRAHFNQAIVKGILPDQRIIDVGGHAVRTYSTTDNDNITPFYNRVHSTLPLVEEAQDRYRHSNWAEQLRSRWGYTGLGLMEEMQRPTIDINGPSGTVRVPVSYDNSQGSVIPNSCKCVADSQGVCKCTITIEQTVEQPDGSKKRETSTTSFADAYPQAFISIDSAYYPGVIEGIEREMIRHPERSSYFAFHDYAPAARTSALSGKVKYSTFDDECAVTIDQSDDNFYYVTARTRGNWFDYTHKIINTHPSGYWFRYYEADNCSIMYTVKDKLDQGSHNYILVQAMCIKGHGSGTELKNHFLSTVPEIFMPQRSISIKEVLPIQLAEETFSIMSELAKLSVSCDSSVESYKATAAGDNVTLLRSTRKTMKHGWIALRLEAKSQDISKAVKALIGKVTTTDYIRIVRQMMSDEENVGIGRIREICDAMQIAIILCTKALLPLAQFCNTDAELDSFRKCMKGQDQYVSRWDKTKNWLSKLVYTIPLHMAKELRIAVIFMVLSLLIWNSGKIINTLMTEIGMLARAEKMDIEYENYNVTDPAILTFLVMCARILFMSIPSLPVKKKCSMKWLKGTCLNDKNQLDMKKNAGRYPPKFRFRDPDLNITGLTGLQAAEKLGCDKVGSIEAAQSGPLIHGDIYKTPTVMHKCLQNEMAACICQCANLLSPDPVIYKRWAKHFRTYGSKLLTYISQEGGLIVNLDEWLQKYPIVYRDQAYKTLERIDLWEKQDFEYDHMMKQELQFTEVEHWAKDDIQNDLKRRAICAPGMDKKIAANAFVYALEGVAHRNIPSYCGRKDWPDICSAIDVGMSRLVDPVIGCADGSKFDRALIEIFQKEFTKFVERILVEGDVFLDDRLNKFDILRAFRGSEELHVNALHHKLNYKTVGRASGDGWTTFGNTLLMLSFWSFIFQELGIPEHHYFLLVKGDDVLFGLSKRYQQRVIDAIPKYFATKNENKSHGLGQIVKYVSWGNLEDSDFLSNHFFMTRSGPRMVRKIERVFQTISWTTKIKPGDKNILRKCKELTYSKGSCMLAWGRGLPIYDVLARKLMQLGQEGTFTDYNSYADDSRYWTIDGQDNDDYSDLCSWFSYKYGLTLSDIQEIETAINAIDDLYADITIPCLDKIYA